MNKRTLLIIAALAVPPLALAIIIQSGPVGQKNNLTLATGTPIAAPPARTISNEPVQLPPLEPTAEDIDQAKRELAQMRQRIEHRLQTLKQMTPAQWPAEQARNRHAPPTLEEAVAHNTAMLSQLEALTPQQWAAGQRPQAPENYRPASGR
jgi:hypothetical protein